MVQGRFDGGSGYEPKLKYEAGPKIPGTLRDSLRGATQAPDSKSNLADVGEPLRRRPP